MKNWIVALLTGFLLVTISSCSVSKKPVMNLPVFDNEGHRGSRGLMPENTIPSMLKGLDIGVTTLEMDAVITSDGQVILSHEPFFNHQITTRPDGTTYEAAEEQQYNIYKMTYAETQRYDVGKKPHAGFPSQQRMPATKPLLSDVIDASEKHARETKRALPFYNIETKTKPQTDNVFHPAPEAFVDILMKVILSKNVSERVIIQSFDFRTLRYLHKKYPGFKTSALIEDYDHRSFDEQMTSLGFLPTVYSPARELVTPALVAACHAKGVKIVPWTVNDEGEMKRLKAMGVDGLISDYPDRLMK
jgi:glycerophosphoryl diester phosphodiesterase